MQRIEHFIITHDHVLVVLAEVSFETPFLFVHPPLTFLTLAFSSRFVN